MSKIAIKSSSSGTATFTIESPATNTDRTLNLPDGSGALYNQSNIVGTVSQSGGGPTGAIIESGSNANGEYVKYADGTMIVWGTVSITPVANTATSAAFTYPATFISAPTPQATTYALASALTRPAMVSGALSTTSINVNIIRTNTTVTESFVTAIGRWF